MYSENTLQVKIIIKNVLSVIEKDDRPTIEFAIQLEVALLMNEDRKGFYKS